MTFRLTPIIVCKQNISKNTFALYLLPPAPLFTAHTKNTTVILLTKTITLDYQLAVTIGVVSKVYNTYNDIHRKYDQGAWINLCTLRWEYYRGEKTGWRIPRVYRRQWQTITTFNSDNNNSNKTILCMYIYEFG